MFKVISDIIAHWHNMINTIVIAINFCHKENDLGIVVYHEQSLWNKMSK